MKPGSLRARLWLASAAVLSVFVALTGFALERALRDSARNARQERLQAQVYLLLAAAEVEPDGRLRLEEPLAEPRFATPGSGLVGMIIDAGGRSVWQSRSTLGASTVPLPPPLPPGGQRFALPTSEAGPRFFVQSFGVSWTTGSGSHRYTFVVAEDSSAYDTQLGSYRRSLWGWLGALSLLLLAVQALTLQWGLRPLRRIAAALGRLERGQEPTLAGTYPAEVQRLADNLNQVLASERARQARYRDALGDLAHSLKTPMAVVRAELQRASAEAGLLARLDEQVQRMDRVVDYHLQRASAAGRRALAPPLAPTPVVERLRGALAKVHAGRGLTWTVEMDPALRARVDEGDLTEMLGNLLDNACKWASARVHVSACTEGSSVRIDIEDDGPGFDAVAGRDLLQRGVRADETVPGQGIGLAVVHDIVEGCGGRIGLERSTALGGARVTLWLPGGVAPP